MLFAVRFSVRATAVHAILQRITGGACFGAHIIHIEEKSMKVTLTKLVKNTTAIFVCYRDGDLWYRITVEGSTEPAIFEFPVPVADTGTGIFTAEIKAITLMRWIRKQLDRIEKGQWG